MENQTLDGQQWSASVWTFHLQQSTPLYPMQEVWSNTPAPQSLPHHFSPQPSDSHPLPIPPQLSPSHIPLPQSPSVQSFKDPKIVSPLPPSGKWEDIKMFIHLYILYINGQLSEFDIEQNKVIWILSHMQTSSARAWHEYIMVQIFKKTLWYNTADELLQEIQHLFGDTDK